jgi:hypothetical protein
MIATKGMPAAVNRSRNLFAVSAGKNPLASGSRELRDSATAAVGDFQVRACRRSLMKTSFGRSVVRAVGLEPTRRCHRGILSPLRLPVPPRPRRCFL